MQAMLLYVSSPFNPFSLCYNPLFFVYPFGSWLNTSHICLIRRFKAKEKSKLSGARLSVFKMEGRKLKGDGNWSSWALEKMAQKRSENDNSEYVFVSLKYSPSSKSNNVDSESIKSHPERFRVICQLHFGKSGWGVRTGEVGIIRSQIGSYSANGGMRR